MEIFLAVIGTLLLLAFGFLIFITIRSNQVHQTSYQVSSALAEYINQKANEMNELSLGQVEAEIQKTIAEANLTQAQADLISNDIKPQTTMGLL